MLDLSPLEQQLPKLVHQTLEQYNSQQLAIEIKDDNSFVTELDIELQERITQLLTKLYPGIAVLGEESDDISNTLNAFTYPTHLTHSTNATSASTSTQNAGIDTGTGIYWIIDPLDGTTNYINQIPFYAHALSLIDNQEVIAAITYDANRQELFTAIKGQGVKLNNHKIQPSTINTPNKNTVPSLQSLQQVVAAIDYKRLPLSLATQLITDQPFKSQRNFGSSTLEWMWLATNRIGVYIHGSQHLWDYAGGLLAINEIGGKASKIDGTSLLPLKQTKQTILASNQPCLHQKLLDLLATKH